MNDKRVMENSEKKITAYKGFESDMTCRGFQYEVGKQYEHKGKVEVCKSGFHACENPMDVLDYYAPCDGNGKQRRYCKVEQSGAIDTDGGKTCSSKIHIAAEIGLDGLVKAGVKFILDKVNWKDAKKSNTGNYSAATNTGDRSAATNTGNRSAATVSGEDSVAVVTGKDSKSKGALGCWLVLTERDEDWKIIEVKAVKVDGEKVKADTWYKLINGELREL